MSQKEKNIFQLARIIAASLKGNANDEEQRTLREWLSVSTRNKKIYDEFKDGKRLEQKIVESQQINWKNDYQHFTVRVPACSPATSTPGRMSASFQP